MLIATGWDCRINVFAQRVARAICRCPVPDAHGGVARDVRRGPRGHGDPRRGVARDHVGADAKPAGDPGRR